MPPQAPYRVPPAARAVERIARAVGFERWSVMGIDCFLLFFMCLVALIVIVYIIWGD